MERKWLLHPPERKRQEGRLVQRANHILDASYRDRGFSCIAGVDEAGRGALAGPVVAAACVLHRGCVIEGVDDSKAMTALERERLFGILCSHPDVRYGLGICSAWLIDKINILRATLLAMELAVSALDDGCDLVLVDGNALPPWGVSSLAVVQGDRLSQSIGAASILAKVTRDQIMSECDRQWSQYGFGIHKGYPTKKHRHAIASFGLSPLHRRSFSRLGKLQHTEPVAVAEYFDEWPPPR